MTLPTVVALFYYAMIGISAYFFIMAVTSVLEMKIRTSLPTITSGPLISVLIPVRNEELNIERCIASLQNQDYRDYEILVLDDNSQDRTYEIIQNIAEQDKRIRIFKGKPLPEDWYGKPFALEQLIYQARGDIVLFTDADTIHNPTSISWAVTNMKNTGADLISGYPGQILKSFGERITIPLLFFLTGFFIPMFLARILKNGYFSHVMGQYIAVKKDVLFKINGFTTIKNKTSEDIFLARYVKQRGYKTEFLDISNQVFCRMYDGYHQAIMGMGKNIYDFLGKNPAALIVSALAIFFLFCLPFPILVSSILASFLGSAANPFLPHLVVVHVLFTLTWLVFFIGYRISWYNAFTWPIMYFNLLFMALWSFYRTLSGRGFVWKDRVVS